MSSKNSVLNGVAFRFELDREGTVEFAFGSGQLRMTPEAAYELQYRLADFLSAIENGEYDARAEAEGWSPAQTDGWSRESGAHLDGEAADEDLCAEHLARREDAIEASRRTLEQLTGIRRPRRLDS